MKLTSEQFEERRKNVWQMRQSGMTLGAIGKKINRCPQAVHVIIAQHERLEKERQTRQSALKGLTVSELMGRSILDLDLPIRAKNSFLNKIREGIYDFTIADVMAMSDKELLRTPNFGKKTIAEMRSVIAKALADAEGVETNVY